MKDTYFILTVLRKNDEDLFIDDCLCRIGVGFAHIDEDIKRKDAISTVYDMLERRLNGDNGDEVVQKVYRLASIEEVSRCYSCFHIYCLIFSSFK